MANKNSKSGNRITRRTTLGAISGATIGGFSIGNVVGSGNDTVKIVTTRDGENRPVGTARVPKSWYNYEMKHLDNQYDKLQDEYSQKDWVESISIGPSNHEVSGKPASVLHIEVNENGENKSTPDHSGEVPVKKVRKPAQSSINHGTCHYNDAYNTVTGGVAMGEGSGGEWGTSCCMVKRDGVEYMLHANHVFADHGPSLCDNADEDPAYQGGADYGTIFGHHTSHDWILIEPNVPDNSSGKIRIKNENFNTMKDVATYATENGLKNYKSNNRTVYSQGVATGYESGEIKNLNKSFIGDEGCTSYDKGVVVSCQAAGGDSGGPIFTYGSAGNIIMIAHAVHSVDNWPDDSLGYACNGEKIEPRKGGWPTYRMLNHDYGGLYNLVTTT